MNNKPVNYLMELCRICMKRGGGMVSIFNGPTWHFVEVPLLVKLAECCQMQLLLEDGLPKNICLQCLRRVNIAYELRKLSANSEVTLIKLAREIRLQTVNKAPAVAADTDHRGNANIMEVIDETRPMTAATACKKKKIKENQQGGSKKTWACSHCKREHPNRTALREHLRTHSDHKPFMCYACGGIFKHNSSLSNHMKIHSAARSYHCEVCSQAFLRSSHLAVHSRTHSGEKPFSCSQCDRSFAQASYLKAHMRLHSGEKPFVCGDCGHGFARKTGLAAHQRTHTGELPYGCPECILSFSQRSQRKRHIKRNHKDSPSLTNHTLSLRDHDKLRNMYKIKPTEFPSSSQTHSHLMLDMPLEPT